MKVSKTLLTLATLTMLWSCGSSTSNESGSQSDSTSEFATGSENTGTTVGITEQDSIFAIEAAKGGMAEVMLGETAQKMATDPKVKEFGKMMVDDHTKANNELKAIAGGKNIMLPEGPGEDKQKEASQVTSKSGKEFDKAYVAQMVKDHEKTVKLFEDGQKNVQDTELKAFINKTLPVLKGHLEHVKGLDKMK
jgi:putative membrane protein